MRPIKSITITQERHPELIQAVNQLGEAEQLMPTSALVRFLRRELPRYLNTLKHTKGKGDEAD